MRTVHVSQEQLNAALLAYPKKNVDPVAFGASRSNPWISRIWLSRSDETTFSTYTFCLRERLREVCGIQRANANNTEFVLKDLVFPTGNFFDIDFRGISIEGCDFQNTNLSYLVVTDQFVNCTLPAEGSPEAMHTSKHGIPHDWVKRLKLYSPSSTPLQSSSSSSSTTSLHSAASDSNNKENQPSRKRTCDGLEKAVDQFVDQEGRVRYKRWQVCTNFRVGISPLFRNARAVLENRENIRRGLQEGYLQPS